MTRFDLIAYSGVLKEYKPESRWAYKRRIRRQMRYIERPFETFKAAAETVFWLALAAAVGGSIVIGIPVMFVRWWLCV